MTLANAGSLADLQRAFQDYLLASSEALPAAVRDTRKADRTTLLDVYRDGYALRLIEVLTNDYPGLMAMAGPGRFRPPGARLYRRPSLAPSLGALVRPAPRRLHRRTPPYRRIAGRGRDGALRMGAGRGVRFARRRRRSPPTR